MKINYDKLCFIHIPKTGGNSIKHAIKHSDLKPKSIFTGPLLHSNHCHYFLDCGHAPYDACKKFLPKYDKILTVAFVRNTWDRMVSLYLHQKKIRTIKNTVSFHEFLDNLVDGKMLCSASQLHFITELQDGFKHPRNLAYNDEYKYNTNIAIDYICRFENINYEWFFINKLMGIDNPPGLPHHNSSRNRGHYRHYYTSCLRDCIYKHFQQEIDFFRFEF